YPLQGRVLFDRLQIKSCLFILSRNLAKARLQVLTQLHKLLWQSIYPEQHTSLRPCQWAGPTALASAALAYLHANQRGCLKKEIANNLGNETALFRLSSLAHNSGQIERTLC